jgi:hypothetical protein
MLRLWFQWLCSLRLELFSHVRKVEYLKKFEEGLSGEASEGIQKRC